ncbi:hypothetical protein ABDK00_010895 [Niabella insulamsoli]|uniref:hypothetical protein n=1 Tax=Niabella insulamsoli TaxID=3144874 RepID=UPI0031FCB713
MKIKNFLINSRAGRSFLTSFGMASNNNARSYFTYKIGNQSDRKVGDYFLYFKKGNVSAWIVDNFAFNEMVSFGATHGIGFLQFQLEQSDDKENFLKYLQAAIPNRRNNYSKSKHELLDYYLSWVNEQLAIINTKESNTRNQNDFSFVNNIQIRNEAINMISVLQPPSFIQSELAEIKTKLKDLHQAASAENNNASDLPIEGHDQLATIIERLGDLEIAIAQLGNGKIETFSEQELKQFVFLLLALQTYHLDNKSENPYFFSQLSKVDITGLLKSNFKYFNLKTPKTTEKDVYKFDEQFLTLDLEKIHKELKKLLLDFK